MTATERFEAWWKSQYGDIEDHPKLPGLRFASKLAYLTGNKGGKKAAWEFTALFMRNYPQTHDAKLSAKLVAIAEHFEIKAQEVEDE